MGFIELTSVSKTHPGTGHDGRVEVLRSFNMQVSRNEFVTLFGPNGCGKTTVLNLIAGLTPCDTGTIRVNSGPAGEVKASYVFQNFQETLLPWRTCLGNLILPLEVSGCTRKKASARVQKFIKDEAIDLPLSKFPYELSGGEKQLLAVCRALVGEPDILLMDEPFNALDYDKRTQMEELLLAMLSRREVTTIFVSHEVDEAVYLSDRVIVLSPLPAEIREEIPIDLDRPRMMKQIQTPRFEQLRERVISAYRIGSTK